MSYDPGNPNPYRGPMESARPAAFQEAQGDATGGIIPYKNPHALIAYYLGIVSLLPLIGVPFGIASIILGFIGLSRRKANPVIKGSVHAWIGIICGFLSLLCGSIFGFGIVAAILEGS
jgi:hypothetical protein